MSVPLAAPQVSIGVGPGLFDTFGAGWASWSCGAVARQFGRLVSDRKDVRSLRTDRMV